MQVAAESNSNMAANTQKSAMKTNSRGVRPSSSRRKVVISDDPKRGSKQGFIATVKSMESVGSKTAKDSPSKTGMSSTLEGAGT